MLKPEDRPTKNYLFVYGTLKQGRLLNVYLDGSVFIGDAITCDKYALYDAGVPFVKINESVSTIKGELYLVDDDVLAMIDGLEGHPSNYKREMVHVKYDGEVIEAWLYFNDYSGGKLVEGGEW